MIQNSTLPIQISSTVNAPAAPARANGLLAQGVNPNGFSQSLAQAAQRQAAPQAAPAPAARPAAAQNVRQNSAPADKNQTARPMADGSKPAPQTAAKSSGSNGASANGSAKDASKADEASREAVADAQAAANSPVLDMLALVAGLNQPAQPAQAAIAATDAALPDDAAAPQAGSAAGFGTPALPVLAAPGEDGAMLETEAAGEPVLTGAAALGMAAQGLRSIQPATSATPAQAPAPAEGQTVQIAQDKPALAAPADGADQAPASFADAVKAALTPATDKAPARSAQDQFIIERGVQNPGVQNPAGAAPAQQTTLAQAVANAAGDKLTARVGTTAWDNQVSQKIVWMVAGGDQSASLTLNPPDLGPMQVVLSVNNDQADVTFSAAQPEVRQALEDAMPRLREMMSESGLSLGNASVNAGMPEGRQAADMAGGQGGRGSSSGGAAGAADTGTIGADQGSAAAAEAQAAARAQRTGAVRSMVDTFV